MAAKDLNDNCDYICSIDGGNDGLCYLPGDGEDLKNISYDKYY